MIKYIIIFFFTIIFSIKTLPPSSLIISLYRFFFFFILMIYDFPLPLPPQLTVYIKWHKRAGGGEEELTMLRMTDFPR